MKFDSSTLINASVLDTPLSLLVARRLITFHRGSPRLPKGATFSVSGLWAESGPTLGQHTRYGWSLVWCATLPECGEDFYEVAVPTFGDIVRIVALGPHEVARRVEEAREFAEKLLGASVMRSGRKC